MAGDSSEAAARAAALQARFQALEERLRVAELHASLGDLERRLALLEVRLGWDRGLEHVCAFPERLSSQSNKHTLERINHLVVSLAR